MSIHVPCKLLDAQCCLRYRTLDQVDQDLRASSYRQNDLLLLRYPDFSDQDLTDFFEGTCVIGLLLVDKNWCRNKFFLTSLALREIRAKRSELMAMVAVVSCHFTWLKGLTYSTWPPAAWARQDVDISAQELENRTEAVALFLNRADTEASARDSILTTCLEPTLVCICVRMAQMSRVSLTKPDNPEQISIWSQTTDSLCQVGVLFLIMVGITLLTRDLNYLSKNLLKPLVELSDEVEPWHFIQILLGFDIGNPEFSGALGPAREVYILKTIQPRRVSHDFSWRPPPTPMRKISSQWPVKSGSCGQGLSNDFSSLECIFLVCDVDLLTKPSET